MSSSILERPLSEVFVSNRPQLRRIAQSIVRTVEQTDEVMQDAFLKIVDIAFDREVRQPFFYCCQVVRNLALDCCRRRTVEGNHRNFDVDIDLVEVPGAPSPHKVLHERQALDAIDRALDRLPAKTRFAFELYRLEGLTQREIAQRLGCSLGQVNGLIADAARAVESCRHLLGD